MAINKSRKSIDQAHTVMYNMNFSLKCSSEQSAQFISGLMIVDHTVLKMELNPRVDPRHDKVISV